MRTHEARNTRVFRAHSDGNRRSKTNAEPFAHLRTHTDGGCNAPEGTEWERPAGVGGVGGGNEEHKVIPTRDGPG